MRLNNILGKKKTRPTGWYKPDLTPDRKLDLVDDKVLAMARSIRWMNERGLPFSEATYSVLISEYSRCARLNWSLTPTQRLSAVKVLSTGKPSACLEEVLRQASKK